MSPSPRKKLPESLTHAEEIEREEATDSNSGSESESGESDSETDSAPPPPPAASAPPPPVVASTASGSETDESASSSEDEAPPPPPASASASASASAPPPVVASTASGSETDESASSSEDEAPPPPPDSVLAPTVTSGASASGSETEIESELPQQPPAPVASQKTLRKRPREVKLAFATKRTRTEETDTTANKDSFERVWHLEDEIKLLQGIIDFKNKFGKVPSHNYHTIYEMTKGSNYLEGKIYSQYSSKITALKTKYLKKNHTFTGDHELLCLALCKHIWIDDLVRVDSDIDWFETSDLVEDLRISVGEVVVKERWSLVSVERKKSLKEKWKVLQARGFERFMLRSELVLEVTSPISKVDNDYMTVDGESESDWLESKLVGDLTRSGLVDEDTVKDKWSLVSIVMKRKLSDKWKVLVEHDLEQLRLRSELVYEISSALYNAN